MNLPETMCAVVLTGHGGLDKLEYHRDWPTPRPASGEVLARSFALQDLGKAQEMFILKKHLGNIVVEP
jgi:hypothetical protein